MYERVSSILCAAGLALAPLAAQAKTPSPVAPGMQLAGTIDTSIASNTAYAGEPFAIDNVTSTRGYGAVTDARVYGHVANVVKSGQGRAGKIKLDFDRIVLHDGRSYALDARPEHIEVRTKNNGLKEAGGAVVGDLLGNYLGKVVGAGLLGPLGLVGGFLIAKNNRQPVMIPRDSLVTLRVLTSRRQAMKS